MNERTIYNEIKYNLCTLFPKEHGNFSINNNECSFTYSKFLDNGTLLFGEMYINDDNKINLDIFRTRDTGDDVQVLHFSWYNINEMNHKASQTENWINVIISEILC